MTEDLQSLIVQVKTSIFNSEILTPTTLSSKAQENVSKSLAGKRKFKKKRVSSSASLETMQTLQFLITINLTKNTH